MTGTWLTSEEVEELTAKTRWTAQCRALARMGVPFTPNAAGRPLIERAVVPMFSGAPVDQPRQFDEGPGLSALRKVWAEKTSPSQFTKLSPKVMAVRALEQKARDAEAKRLHAAHRICARPPWIRKAEVSDPYMEARRLSVETGVIHEVDHIVPLLGKNVCGLHAPWNLRVISRRKNRAKGNRLDVHA